MQTVAILGAAGRIGDQAARAFVKAGWHVKGIARGAKASNLAPGVEPVQADAYDRQALAKACEGADLIVHALNPAYDEWATTVVPLGESVLHAAEATGATVMIVGNVYNFGRTIGPDMAEDAAMPGDTEKGKLRIAMEAMFEKAAAEKGVRTVIVRAGDFFGGTRAGSWIDLMILKDLKKELFRWPGGKDTVHAFAYLPDLAETFVRVAERRAELPAYANLHFRGYAVTGDDMHAAAEKAAGRKLRRGGVPWLMLRAVGLFDGIMREVVAMSYLWRTPHSLSNRRLVALIGEEPHRPLDEALAGAIADMKLDRAASIAGAKPERLAAA